MIADKYKLEICSNSFTSVINAAKAGAHRVELCSGLYEGGLTPSYASVALSLEKTDIQVNVLVRPRGGDFCYSSSEIDVMIRDIEFLKDLGVNGVVIGCLNPDGNVDIASMKRLVKSAQGLSVTFHRAFDMVSDASFALEQIIDLGCDRILTSGLRNNAYDGADNIASLVKQADNRIIIMPGCGINYDNIEYIARKTGAVEFHLSAKKQVASKMEYRTDKVVMCGQTFIDDYAYDESDYYEIKKTIEVLDRIK